MTDEEIIRRLTDIRRSIVQKNKDFIRDDEAMTWAIECVKHASKPCGEWIWKKDEDTLRTYDLVCSECGYKTFTCENYDNVEQAKKVVDDRIREGKTLFPFCPNCGASMSANDRQVTGKSNSEKTCLNCGTSEQECELGNRARHGFCGNWTERR